LISHQVLTPLPEKQGLKHMQIFCFNFINRVLTPLPEKQGLKPFNHFIYSIITTFCINATSRKTRIETGPIASKQDLELCINATSRKTRIETLAILNGLRII